MVGFINLKIQATQVGPKGLANFRISNGQEYTSFRGQYPESESKWKQK